MARFWIFFSVKTYSNLNINLIYWGPLLYLHCWCLVEISREMPRRESNYYLSNAAPYLSYAATLTNILCGKQTVFEKPSAWRKQKSRRITLMSSLHSWTWASCRKGSRQVRGEVHLPLHITILYLPADSFQMFNDNISVFLYLGYFLNDPRFRSMRIIIKRVIGPE